jgi:hypothetical protein
MQFNYREWQVKAKNENKCVGLQSAELRIRLNVNVRNGDQQNANHAGFIISNRVFDFPDQKVYRLTKNPVSPPVY